MPAAPPALPLLVPAAEGSPLQAALARRAPREAGGAGAARGKTLTCQFGLSLPGDFGFPTAFFFLGWVCPFIVFLGLLVLS